MQTNEYQHLHRFSHDGERNENIQTRNKLSDSNSACREQRSCRVRLPRRWFSEGQLDLNHLVVKYPEATFFARVEGDSMKDEGIAEGDILVVNKSIEPYNGCLAVAFVDGEFTLKRVKMEPDKILLIPANPK